MQSPRTWDYNKNSTRRTGENPVPTVTVWMRKDCGGLFFVCAEISGVSLPLSYKNLERIFYYENI